MNQRSTTRVSMLLPLTLLGCFPAVGLVAPAAYQSPGAQETGKPTPPAAQANTTILYTLAPQVTGPRHRLQVWMKFAVTGQPDHISLQMPVWSPGDYHIQDHARYVHDLRAFDAGPADDQRQLLVSHADPNTWEVRPDKAGQVIISYWLPATPPGLFSENIQLQDRQVFVNGPAAYLYLVGHKDEPATVFLHLPAGWHAETPLPTVPASGSGDIGYAAPDYDTLADSPVVMAAPDAMIVHEFTLNNVVHRAVFFGQLARLADADAFTPVLRRIVQAETHLMGTTPYPRYDFLFDVNGAGGGLEHLNACRIAIPSDIAPQRLAPFIAHEFFHVWNVKRLRPRVLGPFDYIHPPHTRNLWFVEGITEYYAQVATLRTGLMTPAEFLDHWRNQITDLQRNPARLKVTAEESSLRVWEAGNSTGYGDLSYYDKGELIGLCLDLKIRHVTGNRRSLDDVMRLLMERHNPPKPGYGEDELRDTISEVADQDLSAFYDRLARSTDEMPFSECLGYAGLAADIRPLAVVTPAQTALARHWMTGL